MQNGKFALMGQRKTAPSVAIVLLDIFRYLLLDI